MLHAHLLMAMVNAWLWKDASCQFKAAFEVPSQATVAAGAHGLSVLQAKAREEDSKVGVIQRALGRSCWKKALDQLTGGCRDMGEEEVRRFALQLTSCDLETSGGRAITCAPHADVGSCLMGLQENQAAWTSYTNNMQVGCRTQQGPHVGYLRFFHSETNR